MTKLNLIKKMNMLKFTKMHGLGNDFVIINNRDISNDLASIVNHIADRRLGIGCDQVIIYNFIDDNVHMQTLNADGSKAETCGNGVRCLVALLYKKYNLKNVDIISLDRKLKTIIHEDGSVSVNMGIVSFNKPWMPSTVSILQTAEKFALNQREMICVDIGNPHLIIFSDHISNKDAELLGSIFEKNELFAQGVNVNIAKIINSSTIELKVWERGTSGFTLACGSGACATYAAARKLGLINEKVDIRFKLGTLQMSYDEGVVMQGPTTFVFTGHFELNESKNLLIIDKTIKVT